MSIALPLAFGGASMLMNLFGGEQSRKANKKASDFQAYRMADLDSQYNRDRFTPLMKTDMGKSYLEQIRTMLEDQSDINKQGAVRTGGTAESRVAAGGELQKQAGRAINQLAGQETQRNDALDARYQRLKLLLGNQEYENLKTKDSNWMNFLSNTNNSLGSLISAWGMGGFDSLGKGKGNIWATGGTGVNV